MTTKQVNKIANPGMNNKFISCRILMNPIKQINKSPHARPNVSTSVAKRPEFNVPDASAVGITLLKADPMMPSKHRMDE
jgi:hypothetical protein